MPTSRTTARTGPTVLSRPVAATLRAWATGTIPPGAPAMATPSTSHGLAGYKRASRQGYAPSQHSMSAKTIDGSW